MPPAPRAGSKRPRPDEDDAPVKSGPATVGQQTAHIGNKIVRSQKYQKLKREAERKKKAERSKRQKEYAKAKELGIAPPPKKVPKVRAAGRQGAAAAVAAARATRTVLACSGSRAVALRRSVWAPARRAQQAAAHPLPPPRPHATTALQTIENTREADVTTVAADDAEVAADEADDEFAAHFSRERPPHVLLTTCYKPSGVMYRFLAEMLEVLPNATYYKRQGFALKKIVEYASNRGFTDLLVFNEDRKAVNGLLAVHLPDGPTAQFRLSNLVLSKDIKVGGGSLGKWSGGRGR